MVKSVKSIGKPLKMWISYAFLRPQSLTMLPVSRIIKFERLLI